MKCAILTLSQDNIARLWSQTEAGYGFQSFDLAGIIDPKSHVFVNAAPEIKLDKRLSSIHWLTGRALSSAMELNSHVRTFKETLNQTINNKLSDTLQEFPDLLFEITASGTMVIWGVQGLGASPHRVTKVHLIMRTENTVPKQDCDFFGSLMTSFCSQSTKSCKTWGFKQ